MMAIEAFANMVKAGYLEPCYMSCPLDMIILPSGEFYGDRLFHQFRCTSCGTVYGMLVNTHLGGQIKINEKAFDPDDYPDKPDTEE